MVDDKDPTETLAELKECEYTLTGDANGAVCEDDESHW